MIRRYTDLLFPYVPQAHMQQSPLMREQDKLEYLLYQEEQNLSQLNKIECQILQHRRSKEQFIEKIINTISDTKTKVQDRKTKDSDE